MLVVESREMKRIEQEAAENSVSMAKLMEQAGTKVASYVLSFINKERRRKICILCGAGNNGGDGFVAARLLAAMGNVTVVLADGKPRTELALASFKLIPQKVFVFSADEKHDECIQAIKSADIMPIDNVMPDLSCISQCHYLFLPLFQLYDQTLRRNI